MKKLILVLMVLFALVGCVTNLNDSNTVVLAPQAPRPPLVVGATTVPKESGTFDVDAPVVISTDTIKNEILANMKELKNSGFTVDILDAQVYGVNDQMAAVGLNIDARYSIFHAKGWIYVRTKPVLDTQRQKLLFTETKLDVQTKNVLVATANWLLNSKLVEQIDKVQFDLTGPINQQKDSFNKQFANMPLSGVGQAHGNVATIEITDYKIADSEFLIRFKVVGTIDIRINIPK
jgi:hypothetical protein